VNAAGEPVPEDTVECLAKAHLIQTGWDLEAAEQAGVPVFRYEDLCADYVVEWPRLLRVLQLECTDRVKQAVTDKAAPEVTPLFCDAKVQDTVAAVEEAYRHARPL
jgi:hypothetical protein